MALSDDCTAFPEVWDGVDISGRCRTHDLAYETGAPKTPADLALASCIASATGDVPIAAVVFTAVLVLGWPFYLAARWRRRRR